jgi:PhzF family phenazine biosynthesis protein
MKFFIVDAFTDQPFGGNPAGVVIVPENGAFPDEEMMAKIAAELRYSETAFIQASGSDAFRIRYFTTVAEVDLCGHATIGSFVALLEAGMVSTGKGYRLETKAGVMEVTVEDDRVFMDMAVPEGLKVISDHREAAELYRVMGLQEEHAAAVLDPEWVLLPELISAGLPDLLLPVADRETLAKIKPDFEALSALSKRYDAIGVHAFALGEGLLGEECADVGQITAYCRNFAPLVGIDEEAATGTSNGALTYYLYKNALIDEGSESLFLQGESMGRPSKIYGRIAETADGIRVRIGGGGIVLARGELG